MKKINILFYFILMIFFANFNSSSLFPKININEHFKQIGSSLKSSLSSLKLTHREQKFLAGSILGLLVLVHFKLQLPWYSTRFPWNPNLNRKIISIDKKVNLYKYSYKKVIDPKKNKLFQNKELEKDLAVVLLVGVGDIPDLIGPRIHEQLFPTDHFYTVGFEDWAKKRVLATSFGQKSEIIPTLIALKHINDDADHNYQKIALFGESRGGAIVIQVIRMLQRIKKGQEEDISRLVSIDKKKAGEIIEKLKKSGIVLKNPLLSIRATAKKMLRQGLIGQLLQWPMQYIIAPIITGFRYNPFSLPEPIDAVRDWVDSDDQLNINIPTLFVPTKDDEVLGNELDNEFFNRLKSVNGEEFSHIYQTESGTHIQPPYGDKNEREEEYESKVWNILSTGNPNETVAD